MGDKGALLCTASRRRCEKVGKIKDYAHRFAYFCKTTHWRESGNKGRETGMKARHLQIRLVMSFSYLTTEKCRISIFKLW